MKAAAIFGVDNEVNDLSNRLQDEAVQYYKHYFGFVLNEKLLNL